MTTNRISAFTIGLVACAALNCGGYSSPLLPNQKDFKGVVTSMSGFVTVDGSKVKAIYLYQNDKMRQSLLGTDLTGIAAEDPSVPMAGLAAVITDNDEFYFNDFPHGQEVSQALKNQKLNLADFTLKPACGTLDKDLQFSPNRDVLCSLATGYQVAFTSNDKVKETLTIQPLYESRLYKPYKRDGVSRPPSAAGLGYGMASFGVSGSSGSAGSRGRPGGRGSDGKPGQDANSPGTSGGNGGNGGAGGAGDNGENGQNATVAGGRGTDGNQGFDGGPGANGANGGSGTPGQHGHAGNPGVRGEDGPTLKIQVKPIFSKFYPDEELVFVQIDSYWHSNTRQGDVYKHEMLNYIFHAGDKFTYASQGGRGGDGGQGGRGGDGGSGGGGGGGGQGGHGGRGGNGGSGGPANAQNNTPAGASGKGGDGGTGGNGGSGRNGGHGSTNGIGGPGGDGGNGGDGGEILATFFGPDVFRTGARSALVFRSIPGEAGNGAPPGDNGNPGSPGSRGSAGSGGEPGDGG
jgi:hypothetical protein